MIVVTAAIVGFLAGLFLGALGMLVVRRHAGHWCQICGKALPLRHRDGEGCRIDRHADIAAMAHTLSADPRTKP